MPYQVVVAQFFDAAHYLRDYPGNCSNIHGHTWKVELSLTGSQLDSLGMLIDFRAIRSKLSQVLDRFDHNLINDLPPFDAINPTAENLAYYIFSQLKDQFPDCHIKQVRVWESELTCAVYYEEEVE